MITESFQDHQLPINCVHPFKSQLEDNRTLIFIYQISCKDPNIKENYIGQTETFENRKYAHSRDSKTSDLKIYQTIRKYGGWDNWEMKIMNHYYCKDEYEARQIEQKYMDIFKATMNSVRAYSKSFIDKELDRQLEFEINDFSDRILGCYLYDYYLELDFGQQMECNFCKKIFSTTSSLNNHKITAKYCLKIQNKTVTEKFKCSYCDKNFTSKYGLSLHTKACNDLNVMQEKEKDKDILIAKQESIIDSYKQQLQKQEDSYKQQLQKQEDSYKEQLQKQEDSYKEQIKELQDKLERLATTAISKPTTTNNNTKITFIAPLDLSHERISNIVTNKLCGDHIVDGMAGIAKFVKDEIITAEDGSLLYGCVDASRQVFKYKNEKGELIKDQKATKLIGAIQPVLKEKTNNMYFEYGNQIENYIEDDEDKQNTFTKKDKCVFLKDTALKIHEDISDMHQNTKFCTELANQVTN